jgi:hypothetical protein
MNYRLERLRQAFANQFEQDGSRLLFRKNGKSAPVEVTNAERDLLIGQFGRRLKWFYPLTILLTLVVLGLMGLLFAFAKMDSSAPVAFAAIAVILAPMMALIYWAWDGPSRFLQNRVAVGGPRTPDEMRARALSKLGWPQLGAALLGCALLLLRVDWRKGLLTGWNLFLVGMVAGLVILVAVQVVRKLMFDQTQKTPDR